MRNNMGKKYKKYKKNSDLKIARGDKGISRKSYAETERNANTKDDKANREAFPSREPFPMRGRRV
jgi:hypothetical protein